MNNGGTIPMQAGELPLPEKHFRALKIASRSTFQRWQSEGLRVLKIGGRRFIYQSDLQAFLEKVDGENVTAPLVGAVLCDKKGGLEA